MDELELFCNKNKINISNSNKENNFKFPKKKLLGENSDRLDDIIVNYKKSLIIDIWVFLFNKI